VNFINPVWIQVIENLKRYVLTHMDPEIRFSEGINNPEINTDLKETLILISQSL